MFQPNQDIRPDRKEIESTEIRFWVCQCGRLEFNRKKLEINLHQDHDMWSSREVLGNWKGTRVLVGL
jgi:hypothetical protein